jgi:hypothetical protein
MNNIANLNLINPINAPKLVFTSQDDIVSDAIELREDGSWGVNIDVSHMMTMTEHGLFNCQDPSGFSQIPVTAYMTKGTKIIFIDIANMTPQAYQAMCLIVSERLGKQGYDWLQIVGQAIGLDFLHMPGTEDCSEEGVREMKGIAPNMPDSFQSLVKSWSNQMNPQQVLTSCLNNPLIFPAFGMSSL